MNIESSLFYGTALTLVSYWIGVEIYKRTKLTLLHPVFTAVVLIVAFLYFTGIPVSVYTEANLFIVYLLTPATICLAIPIYKQFDLLRKHKWLITFSIMMGVFSSLMVVGGLALLFRFEPQILKSVISKSITTGVAIGLTEEIGGYTSITTMAVIMTGIFGAMIAAHIFRIFKIDEPIAKGLAMGVSAHAIGTTKALEMGKIEGAMSSVAMVIAAVMTVAFVPLLLRLLL